jgi:hypothetical protein
MLARPRTLPAGFTAPCLPIKTTQLSSARQWLHEIKHDGFHVVARKDGAASVIIGFGKLLREHGTNAQRRGWAYMPRSLQREPDGVAAALAIHLSLYCAVAALFALVLYYFMQPTRLPNPGMAAHNASARTVSYVELLRSEREAAKRKANARAVVMAEPETTGAATREATDVKPETKKAKAQSTSQSRTRPVRRQQQPPDATHYAQQPFFGGYHPMY